MRIPNGAVVIDGERYGSDAVDYHATYRSAKAERGECRYCRDRVATKRNGKPARLCARHLKIDKDRAAAAKTGRPS